MAASYSPGSFTTVTVTPSSSACSGTSGTAVGGGAPGSASGGSSVPTPVLVTILGTAPTAAEPIQEPTQVRGLMQSQIDAIISMLQAFDIDSAIINNVRSILTAAPTLPTPTSIGVSPVFTYGLDIGMQNDDVKRLQQLLATDSEIYPEGLTTGYFGPLTQSAVQKFQTKYGLAQEGDPGYGYVGPKTRVKLGEIFGQ